MFKNSYQSGFLSILFSVGNKPLKIWAQHIRNGHIKRITDNDINSAVIHIQGDNVSTTYITCPADPKQTLGIKLPYLVMIIKNLKKYFSFEVQVLDDRNIKRRFRASIYQTTTRVKPFICTMPMRLDEGWNQIQFNLGDFTSRAYNTVYFETLRVQVHATCRIRRIFFSSKLYKDQDLPNEYKIWMAPGKGASSPDGKQITGGPMHQSKSKNMAPQGADAGQERDIYNNPQAANEDLGAQNVQGGFEGGDNDDLGGVVDGQMGVEAQEALDAPEDQA
jgi:hypothetical protein